MRLYGLAWVVLAAVSAYGQPDAASAVRAWRERNEWYVLRQFVELLRWPNTHTSPTNLASNARAVATLLERAGMKTELLQVPGAPPTVWAEYPVRDAAGKLVFCAHYDGVEAYPEQWQTGDPFSPVLMTGPVEAGGQPIPLPQPGWPSDPGWRLYGRSVADNKLAILALAAAVEGIRGTGVGLHYSLAAWIAGDGEAGWRSFPQYLDRYGARLAGTTAWIVLDGSLEPFEQPQVHFGVRGLAQLELTVYGAAADAESGRYANWVPDPAAMLARLLASIRDEDGRVLVRDFLHGAASLDPIEKQLLAASVSSERPVLQALGLARSEAGRSLAEALGQPSINVTWMEAGARHLPGRIPSRARALVEVQLVEGMDWRATVQRLVQHIVAAGYHVTDRDPTPELRLKYPKLCSVRRGPGYNASRLRLDSPLARTIRQAVSRAAGEVLVLPYSTEKLPLTAVRSEFGVPLIVVPLTGAAARRHQANESVALSEVWRAVEITAALAGMPRVASAAVGRPQARRPSR